MTERDPAMDPVVEGDEPDFAGEHSRPTYADEQSGEVNTSPDESTPKGRGGDGGMDMENPAPVEPPD